MVYSLYGSILKKEIVMAINRSRQITGYGLSDALPNVFPAPIVSTRDPLNTDRAQLGSVWVNKSTNDAFILCSVVANVSSWVGIGGGAGTFTSLTVNPGNLTVTAGNIIATAGTVTAGGGLTVTTGGALISSGNLTLTTGSITAALGNITATAGSLQATAGRAIAVTLETTGDFGAGFTGTTSFTNVTNTTQSSGALTLLSGSANSGTNAGFIKIYVGTAVAYLPYFTNIAP
jgi:hypothetical protein